MSTLRIFTSLSAVAMVSLTTSSVMGLSQIPSGTEPPMPSAVLVWVDVETGNLTIYIDSSGGDDADQLSDLEIVWLETEGGFITENCLNLDGPFDVCTPKGLLKMASMGPVLDLGDVFPPETQPCDLMETLRVDGQYLTGGGLDKYDWQSPYINCPYVTGDYNNDGVLGAADLNLQAMHIVNGPFDPSYDLNGDSVVDFRDREVWVYDLKLTWFGDANLDLEFNSSDFVQVFQRGKYETSEYALWEEGDWNGDTVFDSGDIVTAFAGCGYEVCTCEGCGIRPTVPEPSGWLLLLLATICLPKFRAVSNSHFDE